jgi:parallel beta-helix repeat protein
MRGVGEFEKEDFLSMFALNLKRGSLVVALALALLPAALAAEPAVSVGRLTCLVSNERTGVGSRSLQEAIDVAAAGDTLVVKGTCFGNSVIHKALTLRGVSNKRFGEATLDGSGAATVLAVNSPVDSFTLAINDLTITHGTTGVRDGGFPGHTIELTRSSVSGNYGDGILASQAGTHVTLTDSAVSDNAGSGVSGSRVLFGPILRSSVSNNGGCGIGIGLGSSVAITDSTVSGNGACGVSVTGFVLSSAGLLTGSTVSDNGGPGIIVIQEASVSLSGSTVSGNQGPGIQSLFGGGVSLLDSSVSGNSSSGSGGGIDVAPGLTVLRGVAVINSSVTGNSAELDGGGIAVSGPFTVTNSIVSGNTAGRNGGGIYLADSSSSGTLTDSTISSNTATSGGGIYNNGGSVTLSGTNLFANNIPDNCVGVAGC